ncbi:MAG TPA: fatty acid desaturase [Methyloceanibacter sp.]|nr:fatty acid desaturase [Methyloceanibacter sp.]
MKRDGGNGLDSSSPDGSCAALAMDPPRSKPDRSRVLAVLRYGSANFLLLLGAVPLVLGGWATWVVLALALVFGSFADEIGDDDNISLKQGRCLFCTANLYLTLPLVSVSALLLVRFAAERQSLTGNIWETIGALWLTGYLFALAGATVAHELTPARLIGGWRGALVIFLAGLIGRSFHELINYVQHYGLVRVENSPIKPHHSWDCYRSLSNAVHYNLPRHSDHHMFAGKAFWQLDTQQTAPTLPYGYQTMAFIALTPPLWRQIMRPLLVDWDKRFASDAEREVVRERGWEGVA